MELEQWLRKDMERFVKEHETREEQTRAVRHEDEAQLRAKDYLRRIEEALARDRYDEAKILFVELRDFFLALPLDHQDERKLYYRLLQKCYKRVYDYVAEQHKTVRIIHQLNYDANVFDQKSAPVDLKRLEHSGASPVLSIEDLMMRGPARSSTPTLQHKAAPEPLEMPSLEASAVNEEPAPSPPAAKQPLAIPHGKHDAAPLEEKQEKKHAFAPPWSPPDIHFDPHRKKKAEALTEPAPQTQPKEPPVELLKSTARELTRQARAHLLEQQPEKAQQKLIEARFEAAQAGGDAKIEEGIAILERHLAQLLTKEPTPAKDSELFSTNYLRGIQAMAAGDYRKASESFMRRVQQAPRDTAARIRLSECMEVINGTHTR